MENKNMNMQSLMAQAQKMQKEIMGKKNEINNQTFTGNSELVTVTVNGEKKLLSVEIKSDCDLTKDDIEVLQDMIVIACNDAFKQVDEATEKAMGQYGSSLNGLI
jgi:DNA-binding YbaB/EbfC family protein